MRVEIVNCFENNGCFVCGPVNSIGFKLKFYIEESKIPVPTVLFHGDLSAKERETIYKDFVAGNWRLLIATDVLARGIDVQSVNVVVNFDMPRELQTYIHRVGRSGRYGRKGVAISLIVVSQGEGRYEGRINEMLKVKMINDCSKKNEMVPLPENIANLL